MAPRSRRAPPVSGSEITDKRVYLGRRGFIAAALSMAAGATFPEPIAAAQQPAAHGRRLATTPWPGSTNEKPNTWANITTYNPNQNGAPIRVVVPWKYGFKGAKSIVRIRFVEKQPVSSWMQAVPQAYGFYANVNPAVPHPMHSQATEVRLPGLFKNVRTQLFNGYADQVASLYTGMDLKKQF